jgi:hypothetical protein
MASMLLDAATKHLDAAAGDLGVQQTAAVGVRDLARPADGRHSAGAAPGRLTGMER